jgi:hypothetical protein
LLFYLSHQNGHIGAFSYSKIKIEIDVNNDELLAIIWKYTKEIKGEGGGDVPQFGTLLKGYTYDHKIKV